MNKFRKPHGNRDNNRGFGGGGGRPSFDRSSGSSRFGGSRDGNQQKFDAVCAECGKPCQVPFRPNGTRPVYCSVCFGNQRQDAPASHERESFQRRESFAAPSAPKVDDRVIIELKRQVDTLSSKIDIVLKILQTSSRPDSSPMKAEAKSSAPKDVAKKKPLKKKGPVKR